MSREGEGIDGVMNGVLNTRYVWTTNLLAK